MEKEIREYALSEIRFLKVNKNDRVERLVNDKWIDSDIKYISAYDTVEWFALATPTGIQCLIYALDECNAWDTYLNHLEALPSAFHAFENASEAFEWSRGNRGLPSGYATRPYPNNDQIVKLDPESRMIELPDPTFKWE